MKFINQHKEPEVQEGDATIFGILTFLFLATMAIYLLLFDLLSRI